MPVLGGFEGVVGVADGLDLLDLAFAIKGSVACVRGVSSCFARSNAEDVPQRRKYVMTPIAHMSTGFPCPVFLKICNDCSALQPRRAKAGTNLGSHVPRSSACRRQSAERRVVNHLAEAKVGNEEVRILVLASEQEVFRLEVCSQARQLCVVPFGIERTSVNDPSGVEVGDGADDDLDELGCIVLVVGSLGADTVKELSTLAEVGDEVDWVRCEVSLVFVGVREGRTHGCFGSVIDGERG